MDHFDDPAAYCLPSHPRRRCLDPLGLTDLDDPSEWDVITAALRQFRASNSMLTDLPALIQELSYSIHRNGQADTDFLSEALDAFISGGVSHERTLERLLCCIEDTPRAFPSHAISYLTSHSPKLTLSSRQLRCLISHQLLNTLTPPPNNTWGSTFINWYSRDQPLPFAVRGYLETVLQFFDRDFSDDLITTYELVTSLTEDPHREPKAWFSLNETPFNFLTYQPTTSSITPFPHSSIDCTLVSSNREPGFGISCTQEELVTAASPALLPLGALFINNPLPADNALIVTGFSPMTRWTGVGREARRTGDLVNAHHTFLLLDASELDLTASDPSRLQDVVPLNLMRDLFKAYTGFRELASRGIHSVFSPIWGAGAFGGDPVAKTLILAMAAARAGVHITLLVDENRTVDERTLVQVLADWKSRAQIDGDWTIGKIMGCLYDNDAVDTIDLVTCVQSELCNN